MVLVLGVLVILVCVYVCSMQTDCVFSQLQPRAERLDFFEARLDRLAQP